MVDKNYPITKVLSSYVFKFSRYLLLHSLRPVIFGGFLDIGVLVGSTQSSLNIVF